MWRIGIACNKPTDVGRGVFNGSSTPSARSICEKFHKLDKALHFKGLSPHSKRPSAHGFYDHRLYFHLGFISLFPVLDSSQATAPSSGTLPSFAGEQSPFNLTNFEHLTRIATFRFSCRPTPDGHLKSSGPFLKNPRVFNRFSLAKPLAHSHKRRCHE